MTTRSRNRTLLLLGALVAWSTASPALAHTFSAAGAGLGAGLVHPLLGLDHLLAMIAVGLWAGQQGGAAAWRVPGILLGVMAAGALLGLSGVPIPAVEFGVAGSVLLFGILVALSARLPRGAAMAVVGVFALFHGHAHGAELAMAAAPAHYGLGFLLATASLLGAAALIARRSLQRASEIWLRAGGAAIAAAGAALLVGAA
jgi:urease accessory protein